MTNRPLTYMVSGRFSSYQNDARQPHVVERRFSTRLLTRSRGNHTLCAKPMCTNWTCTTASDAAMTNPGSFCRPVRVMLTVTHTGGRSTVTASVSAGTPNG